MHLPSAPRARHGYLCRSRSSWDIPAFRRRLSIRMSQASCFAAWSARSIHSRQSDRMARNALEVADIVRLHGEEFAHTPPYPDATQGTAQHPALPHRGARRARLPLRGLRLRGELLQLMPRPALSKVPGQQSHSSGSKNAPTNSCRFRTSTRSSRSRTSFTRSCSITNV